MTTEAEALFAQIKALSPPDRLRLAADLMERRRGDVACGIVRQVADELGAALALRDLDARAAGKAGGR